MFQYLPNLKKIVLDYNLLVVLPKIEESLSNDVSNLSKQRSPSPPKEQSFVLQKLNHFSATNNKINEFPISLFLRFKHLTGQDTTFDNQIMKGPI